VEVDGSEVRIRIAEALSPLLEPFHSVHGESLHEARRMVENRCLTRLVLTFETARLIVSANGDDDTVEVASDPIAQAKQIEGEDVSGERPWDSVIGKPFGWGWVTVNQQGYCDGLLIGFGAVVPQISLCVVASSIKIACVKQSPELP
jgi:hypothetical protein